VLSRLIEQVEPSVAKVQITTTGGKLVDSGTGVATGPRVIATCYHVIDPDDCGRPHRPTINGEECVVRKTNPSADLALLESKREFPPILPKAFSEVTLGDEILFFGYPAGVGNLTVHKGMVSAKGNSLLDRFKNIDMIQIDGTVNLGNSGGPAIDISSGKLIGIVTAKYGPFLNGIYEFKSMVDNFVQQPEGEIGLGSIDQGKFTNFTVRGFATLAKPLLLVQVGIGYAVSSDYVVKLQT
jgi:S1-C subfamily serine protease